ncbi:MAG TPA: rhodanese-like domain-containing protein [Trebonia sp.]
MANPPAAFTPKVRPALRATVDEVLASIAGGTATLVDARDPGQYTGTVTRPGNRGGHIPGAINIPREDLVDLSAGTWRSAGEIAGILAAAGLSPDDLVIAYCNGGVAATAVQFGMAMAGYPAVATTTAHGTSGAPARTCPQPDRYVVTVGWASLAAHVDGFRGTPQFEQWIGAIRGLIDLEALDTEHYARYSRD